MKVRLHRRHHGVHDLVRETEVPGTFAEWATPGDPGPGRDWTARIRVDEERLVVALPEGFLPVPPSRVLVGVEDEDSGTALSQLTVFRPWGKYFDAYCLWLVMDGTDAALNPAVSA